MEAEKIKEKLISDISYYIRLGFDLTPLNVQLPNNTKYDFSNALAKSEWWLSNILYTEEDLIKSINNGNVGYLIHTNDKTDICGVDFDIKNKDGTFKEETNESKHLLNLLLSSGTLTIQTPSGGFHNIFKKNNDIKTNNANLLDGGFVDIKTINQVLFCGYRSDGFYNIIDKSKTILQIPDDILKRVKDNINIKEKKV